MITRPGPLWHAAAFLLLGSQALHHLRFLVARSQRRRHPDRARHGGAHLAATGPAIAVMIAVLLAWLVVRAAGAPRGVPARSVRLWRVWPLAVLALLASYGSQELLEGALGHGHVEGDGWVAAPLAVGLGGLIAIAVRIAHAADELILAPAVRIGSRCCAPMTRVDG